jgi:cbb3-type cytochrome oxidase subunit 3
MNILINALSYLLAFLVGAGVVWLVIRRSAKSRPADEAVSNLNDADGVDR